MSGSHSQEKKLNPNLIQAEQYLRKHHILELFEDLCTAVCYKKPEDINKFLIEELELRQKHGIHVPIFTEDEVENIFNLYDLKRKGVISRYKCREALQSMSNTALQFSKTGEFEDIPNEVDLPKFKELR